MIKPSKYKSISTKELKTRAVAPLSPIEKTQVNIILNKMIELIKAKYA